MGIVAEAAGGIPARAIGLLNDYSYLLVLLSTSAIVVASVFATLALVIWFGAPAHRWRGGTVRPRVLARALLPRRLLRSRSGRLDIAALLFSLFLSGSTMGWALVSSGWYAEGVHGLLAGSFAPPAARLPLWLCGAISTVALFLAYEFAYWLDHYLSHRVPILWAFHKVHHTAESLSMLTNYRVHPVDTIVFYNIVAAVSGTTAAAIAFLLGRPVDAVTVGTGNLLVFATSMTLTHLQHSHLWISLPGAWGKWLLSPAHHQIHHSIAERHHNRNLGSSLAIFDRMFGTLHRPSARREPLTFGVSGIGYDPHGFRGAVLMPFAEAGGQIVRRVRSLARARGAMRGAGAAEGSPAAA